MNDRWRSFSKLRADNSHQIILKIPTKNVGLAGGIRQRNTYFSQSPVLVAVFQGPFYVYQHQNKALLGTFGSPALQVQHGHEGVFTQ